MTCSSENVALSCKDGFYLGSGSDDGNCLPCPNGGSICDASGNPLACAIGYF